LAASGIALAAPAVAEGVHIGPGGVDVHVGPPPPPPPRVERRIYRDSDFARGHCRTVVVERDGVVKTIRRCR
jgi:hypothetical protein